MNLVAVVAVIAILAVLLVTVMLAHRNGGGGGVGWLMHRSIGITCPDCGGMGSTEEDETCPRCNGRRYIWGKPS